jgi:hypothetical protein
MTARDKHTMTADARLNRQGFTTSRLLEFCSVKEPSRLSG